MLRMLLAAAAAFFVSASLVRADDQCWPRDDAASTIQGQARQMDGGYTQFSYERAESFLDVVNKAGDPTDYHADEILVIFIPSSNVGLVFLVNKGCADPGPITVGAVLLVKALRAAHQIGV